MKSYKALKAQIAKLEQQAEALRQSEVRAVVNQLKKTIAEYGLTADDLGLAQGAARGRGRPAGGRRRAGAGVAKYRDPSTGQTWTGRGRPPAWIAAAKDREAFRIDPAPSAENSAGDEPRRARASVKRSSGRKPGGKAVGQADGKGAAKKSRRPRGAGKSPAVQIEGGVAME